MNREYSWESFTGSLFQELCSAILIEEISKHARVYSAPGKDQGFDQYYEGEYHGKQGCWRFQVKFHSNQDAKSRSAFKSQVKADITDHYKGEDYIVFLTNLELNHLKMEEILQAASAQVKNNKVPEILIWDGGKIKALLDNLPRIYYQYWGNSEAMLVPYREGLARYLDNVEQKPYHLSNPFFGRNSESEKLLKFLDDPDKTVISIVGKGGFGKTRLCVEFFEKYIDENEEWDAFLYISNSFNVKVFDHCLRSDKKMIIVIDDADQKSELPGIIEVARLERNRKQVKILITTRSALFDDIKDRMPNFAYLSRDIILNALGEKESLDATLSLLKKGTNLSDKDVAGAAVWVSQQSNGIPLLITTLCFSILKHRNFQSIYKEEELDFSRIVWRYINEEIRHIAKKNRLEEKNIVTFLGICSLITPFKIESWQNIIRNQLGLSSGDLKRMVNGLIDAAILERFNPNAWVGYSWKDDEIKIERLQFLAQEEWSYQLKPDPYRDIFLKNFISEDELIIELLRSESGKTLFMNSIRNLTAVGKIWDELINPIEELIVQIPELVIEPDFGEDELQELISVASNQVNSFPDFALRTLELVVLHLKENKSIFRSKNFKGEIEFNASRRSELEGLIKRVIVSNGHFDEAFASLVMFCDLLETWEPLFKCLAATSSSSEPNQYHRNFALTKNWIRECGGRIEFLLILQLARGLMGLNSPIRPSPINLDIHYDYRQEKDTQIILEFRGYILEELFSAFDSRPEHRVFVAEILLESVTKLLGNHFGLSRSFFGDDERFEGINKEFIRVTNFFKGIPHRNRPFPSKVKVLETLANLPIFNLSENAKSILAEMHDNWNAPTSHGEKAALALYSKQAPFSKLEKIQLLLESFRELAPKEVVLALAEVKSFDLTIEKNKRFGYHSLIEWVGEAPPLDHILLFEQMKLNAPDLIEEGGTFFLGYHRFIAHNDEDWYWNELRAFVNGDPSIPKLRGVLQMYSWFCYNHRAELNLSDLDFFESIVEMLSSLGKKSVHEDYDGVCRDFAGTVLFFHENHSVELFKLMERFMEYCTAGSIELFLARSPDWFHKGVAISKNTQKLVENHSQHLDLYLADRHLAGVLQEILEEKGFAAFHAVILRNLEQRFENQISVDFPIQPFLFGNRNFGYRVIGVFSLSDERILSIFCQLVEWMVQVDFDSEKVLIEDALAYVGTFTTNEFDWRVLIENWGNILDGKAQKPLFNLLLVGELVKGGGYLDEFLPQVLGKLCPESLSDAVWDEGGISDGVPVGALMLKYAINKWQSEPVFQSVSVQEYLDKLWKRGYSCFYIG